MIATVYISNIEKWLQLVNLFVSWDTVSWAIGVAVNLTVVYSATSFLATFVDKRVYSNIVCAEAQTMAPRLIDHNSPSRQLRRAPELCARQMWNEA